MELERSTVLIQCVTELSSHEDVDQAINNLLKIVTEYFQGDRTYIFEMDYEEKLVHNTYEYAAAGSDKGNREPPRCPDPDYSNLD